MTKFDSAPSSARQEDAGKVGVPNVLSRMVVAGSVAVQASGQEDAYVSTRVFETVAGELSLTIPESRVYGVGEEYSFLVHAPLSAPDKRFGEIGTDREGVLMATIINGQRQGTFEGSGGILVQPTSPDSIMGMSEYDEAGAIMPGRTDPVTELLKEADNSEYNQVDLSFSGGEAVGIVIKVSEDGVELGDAARNRQLRDLAELNGIPVALIEVKPSDLPTEANVRERALLAGDRISTIDVPYDNGQFMRVDIAHGEFYYDASGITTRSMTVDRYGQYSHRLTEDQVATLKRELARLNEEGVLSDAEVSVAIKGLTPKDLTN